MAPPSGLSDGRHAKRINGAMSGSVEFRHLEYLLAIYEGKNFTKAAERVYPCAV